MTLELQLLLLAGSLIFLFIIFFMLKTNRLSVKFAIIWLFFGFSLVSFAAVPYIVYVLRDIFGIEMPSNLVFSMTIGFMLLILLSLSATVTQFSQRIKRLTQTIALLEKRVRELEQSAQNQSNPK